MSSLKLMLVSENMITVDNIFILHGFTSHMLNQGKK